ncbi:MAG: HRDC domain-containing protein [Candidatus Omnitrophota bacterium]
MIYVNTPELLREATDMLAPHEWVALDTEADSLHHFEEKLSLVQLSVPGSDFVIDPLAKVDLEPLVAVLRQKSVIVHGADFDIKIINKNYPFIPVRVFDTLIAASLLGYPKQGLADLALRHCGVSLCKKAQKADWSKRPLSEPLLEYAANDTHYLTVIKNAMEAELIGRERLGWHTELCQRLLDNIRCPKKNIKDPADGERSWQIAGSRKLSGRGLTILRQLWLWRADEAKLKDRPFFKVLGADYMLDLAEWAQKHPGQDVERWASAPRHLRGVYRSTINEVLAKAQAMPEAVYEHKKPARPRRQWSAVQHQRYAALKEARQKLAHTIGIAPNVIATNSILDIIATEGPRDIEALRALGCLMNWQIEVAGETLLKEIVP